VTANLFENILLDLLQKNLFWTYQTFGKLIKLFFSALDKVQQSVHVIMIHKAESEVSTVHTQSTFCIKLSKLDQINCHFFVGVYRSPRNILFLIFLSQKV